MHLTFGTIFEVNTKKIGKILIASQLLENFTDENRLSVKIPQKTVFKPDRQKVHQIYHPALATVINPGQFRGHVQSG